MRSKFISGDDYRAIWIGFSLSGGISVPSELGRISVEQDMMRGFTVGEREWMFCFAFVSTGLSTNFRELRA